MKSNDKLLITRWEAERLENALRMLNNAIDYKKQETCLDRELISATNIVNNVLNGEPNKAPNRFKVDTTYRKRILEKVGRSGEAKENT